jgi:hypothetical protein
MNYFQARSDLKMEFFHLISFLLSHCMNNWRVPNDQVMCRLLHLQACFPCNLSSLHELSMVLIGCPSLEGPLYGSF